MISDLKSRPNWPDRLPRTQWESNAYAANLLEEAARAATIKPSLPAAAKDLVELFAPLRGLNLYFERDRDAGRDIDL